MSNSREKNQPPPPNLLANNSQVISDRVPVRPLQDPMAPSLPSVPSSVSRRSVKGCLGPTSNPRNKKMHEDRKIPRNPLQSQRKSQGHGTGQRARQNSNPARTANLTRNHERKMTDGGRDPAPDSVSSANPAPEKTKGAADAAPFQHSMPTDRPKDQRLENWNDRRAFALPYFFRSTTRLSRVRKPAAFSAPRRPGS